MSARRGTTLALLLVVVGATVVGCSSDEAADTNDTVLSGADGGDSDSTAAADPAVSALASNIRSAVGMVDGELGAPQAFFEVTATSQLTNVFVAIDDATAAVPYVVLDGQLQPPGPTLDGASGLTFAAEDITFDEDLILSQVSAELPSATIDSLSVEGGNGDGVRYVVSATSSAGGVLDIVVGPTGEIFSVEPL